jgi:UDP-N-acetylmuramoyl-L-alanyl-D-glutamate--2,6-diaminopimelate ligase
MIEDTKPARPRGSWPGPPPSGLALDELSRELPMTADVAGDPAVRVRGVRHDSRAVQPGDLFVARRGEKVDGVLFVRDAVGRGATAVMAARGAIDAQEASVPVLFVDDPAAALGFAASAVYGHPSFSLEVVGITGTNGKTTTAHLARAAVDGALGAPLCGILGTVGQRFGDWSAPAEHTTPEADDLARTMMEMRSRGGWRPASASPSSSGRGRRTRWRSGVCAACTSASRR